MGITSGSWNEFVLFRFHCDVGRNGDKPKMIKLSWRVFAEIFLVLLVLNSMMDYLIQVFGGSVEWEKSVLTYLFLGFSALTCAVLSLQGKKC